MSLYSEERKAMLVSKLLPPHNRSVMAVSEEEGISKSALYSWLKQSREQGVPVPGSRSAKDDWSAHAKLAVLIETASLSEVELSAYCREKGLYPEQIQHWKEACFSLPPHQDKATQKQHKADQKIIKELRAEVRRKDRVLAETTALLVLSKKLEALYGNDPDSDEDN